MLVKLGFLALFAATIAIIIFCLKKISKTDKPYKTPLAAGMTWSIFAILGVSVVLITGNEFALRIGYTIFFIGIDWILYFLFEFTCKYSKYEIKNNVFVWLLVAALIVDSISLFLNIFFLHAFTINMEIKRIVFLTPYNIHLALSYIISALIMGCLINKMITSPKIYRLKYTSILIIFIAVLIADGLYILSNVTIDFSIIFFALAAVVVSYFAFVYSPKTLVNRSLTLIVENMDDPIIFFSDENECIYKNSAFENFMNEYQKIGLNPKRPFEVWKGTHTIQNKEFSDFSDQRFTQELEKNGKTYSFNIWYHNLRDEKNMFLGTFFQIHDKTKELEKENLQKYLTTHDKLTSIYNTETFYEKVEEYLKYNPDKQYLMICSDIENFKLINDLFGKVAADKFIVNTAKSLKASVTTSDIYGRIGGDRFALLLEKQYFLEDLFIEKINEISHIDMDMSYPVIFHIGVYEIEDTTLPASVMCDRALMAIQSVEGDVHGVIAYYTDEMRETVLKEQRYTGEFKEALSSGQFTFYIQPQIKSGDSCCNGGEALARWIHPEVGIVHPSEFISLFEKNGIISDLDLFIWEEAAKKLREWKELGHQNTYLSVNISPKDMAFIDIYEHFTSLVEKYQISPKNLHLEITETAILLNVKTQIHLIKKLREYGFIVEMDDFGSGYSSFNMLKNFNFDVIKIDMEFLHETLNIERSRKILQSIISLSRELGMSVIVEGIEQESQQKTLSAMGCDLFQGYLFDKPLEISEFEKKYMNLKSSVKS